MLTVSPIASRPSVAPGNQTSRQMRAIRAYTDHGHLTDPGVRWELERAARAERQAPPATPAKIEPTAETDMPWPRLLLGAAATVLVWAFIGWALAPYLVVALAWLFGLLA